jgi:hypothetical protein
MSNIFWEHRKVQKHVTETIRAACHVSPNTSPRYMSAMCAMKRPSAVVWGAAATGSYVSTTGAYAPRCAPESRIAVYKQNSHLFFHNNPFFFPPIPYHHQMISGHRWAPRAFTCACLRLEGGWVWEGPCVRVCVRFCERAVIRLVRVGRCDPGRRGSPSARFWPRIRMRTNWPRPSVRPRTFCRGSKSASGA